MIASPDGVHDFGQRAQKSVVAARAALESNDAYDAARQEATAAVPGSTNVAHASVKHDVEAATAAAFPFWQSVA